MIRRGIRLGEREETLAFTVNSVCLLEETAGQPLSRLLAADVSGLRALLWCGLIHARPGMTLAQAGDLIDGFLRGGGSLDDLCDQLCAALEDAVFFQRAKRTE